MTTLRRTSLLLRERGFREAALLIDRRRAEANIARYAARARASGTILRPHFKTHQSAAVARWFRAAGADRAAVSSVGMARYFANHGWGDLTLAIGANPLQIDDLDALAGRIALGVTVDGPAACTALLAGLRQPVALWIEVDTGQGRCGVPWDDRAALVALARLIHAAATDAATGTPGHRFGGLLTHAGQSYAARSPQEAAAVFATVRRRLQDARAGLQEAGLPAGAISAGDTPGFAAVADWSGIDEARCGNFVFCDLMQLEAGACAEGDLACAVVCPVIGVYPGRGEAVVHAGAVHLSREGLRRDGREIFGRLLALDDRGFAGLSPGWEVAGLSQEHGLLAARTAAARDELAALAPGDLVLVAPVHACLACEQFGGYRTCDGEVLPRYRRD